MILIQQRYRSSDPARQAELDHVREVNHAAAVFDDIVEIEGGVRRQTFADLFAVAVERCAGKAVVIANSDISFDDSIAAVETALRPGMLVALTRWDDATSPSMEGRVDPKLWRLYSQSQDTWIFIAGSLPNFPADFQLGVPRCENRLAYEAAAAGVVVVDPALSVRSMHHHATNVRSWKRGDYYRGPLLFPRLTTLDNPAPEAVVLSRYPRKLERRIALDGSAGSFATQMSVPCAVRGRRLGLRSPFYWRTR